MAKTQIKIGRWRRFFGWFGRHKVAGGFGVLVLAVVFYGLGWWVVQGVQIHFERERFMRVQKDVYSFAGLMTNENDLVSKRRSSCSYTSNGAIFARKYLGCSTGIDFAYRNIPMEKASSLTAEIKSRLSQKGISLQENNKALGKNDLGVYIFEDNKIDCTFSSTYYADTVIFYERYKNAPPQGEALFVAINCGGSAKAQYFPLAGN